MPLTDIEARSMIERYADREAGKERLAVIRRPSYGVDDRNCVSLRFTTYISESGAADQRLTGEEAEKALADANVQDVADLDGKVAWVYTGDRSFVRFIEIARI